MFCCIIFTVRDVTADGVGSETDRNYYQVS